MRFFYVERLCLFLSNEMCYCVLVTDVSTFVPIHTFHQGTYFIFNFDSTTDSYDVIKRQHSYCIMNKSVWSRSGADLAVGSK